MFYLFISLIIIGLVNSQNNFICKAEHVNMQLAQRIIESYLTIYSSAVFSKNKLIINRS